MRHRVAKRKLGRTTPHRIALLRNLATALIERERIRTTLMKAKELRPFAERLITLAKREGDARLHARRQAARQVNNPAMVCQTQGETLEEAMDNIREAIALYLETLPADRKLELLSCEILTTSVEVQVA